MEQDLLIEFEEDKKTTGRNFSVLLIIRLYSIQVIISLFTFFITLKIGKIDLGTLFSTTLISCLTLTERIIPFLALILFTLHKRSGWVLVMFLSIIDFLLKTVFLVIVMSKLEMYIRLLHILLFIELLSFIFSLVIICLLFTKKVTTAFQISIAAKISTAIISIVAFVIIKFYLVEIISYLR